MHHACPKRTSRRSRSSQRGRAHAWRPKTRRRAGSRTSRTIIGISGDQTPLLERSDVPIVVEALENTDLFTPTISRIAELVVIDVLATGVLLRQHPDDVERVRRMKSQTAAMRTGRLDGRVEGPAADGDMPADVA